MDKEILVPEELITEEIEEMVLEGLGDDLPGGEPADEEKSEEESAEGGEAADKMVPLTALQKEREKVRGLKRDRDESRRIIDRLFKTTGISSLSELEKHMDRVTLQSYMREQGASEEVARLMMEQQEKLSELEKLKRRRKTDLEVQGLKENPYYSDIDEVYEIVADYADDKGLSVKEAYSALYGDKMIDKIKSIEREAALSEARSKNSKKIPALSSGGNTTDDETGADLSPEEMGWARAAGISPKDYARYK